MSVWLLVHSPLLGPTVWEPFARLVEARGIPTAVPDLTGVATAETPMWEWLVNEAVAAAGEASPVTVLGHSGAGVFLPQIGHRLQQRLNRLIFVDAIVPPTEIAHTVDPEMSGFLDDKIVDGQLASWFDWWPEGVVEEILPDADLLRRLRAESPRLPRDFYDETVPVPDGWSDEGCRYLRLSEGYDEALAEAERRGWRTGSLEADHLCIVTNPRRVLEAVLQIF